MLVLYKDRPKKSLVTNTLLVKSITVDKSSYIYGIGSKTKI